MKVQREIIELRNIITVLKNSIQGFNSRLEDRAMEFTPSEMQKGTRTKENECRVPKNGRKR